MKDNELLEFFIRMFGEKYGRSFYLKYGEAMNRVLEMYPDDYKDDESKKELVASGILGDFEYLNNKDTVFYE